MVTRSFDDSMDSAVVPVCIPYLEKIPDWGICLYSALCTIETSISYPRDLVKEFSEALAAFFGAKPKGQHLPSAHYYYYYYKTSSLLCHSSTHSPTLVNSKFATHSVLDSHPTN